MIDDAPPETYSDLPGGFPRYRLLTGTDDRRFCERVSQAMDDGWYLYDAPSITALPDGSIRVAQALVWPQ